VSSDRARLKGDVLTLPASTVGRDGNHRRDPVAAFARWASVAVGLRGETAQTPGVYRMSIDPIVVGSDGSATAEVAVDRAGELAHALGASVHVVTAYSLASSGAWMAGAGMTVPSVVDDGGARQAAEEIVGRTSGRLRQRGLEVATHVCQGDPADVLITVADGEHAQMIVVGNRGMAGARRVLGSVPNRVSHHARCGVLIVPTS
jgi:nucleotide-binding universal stress UspA family protein